MFDSHLTYLKQTFQKNCYSENDTNRYFELFLNVNHIFKEKVPVVAKKPLQLFFPYLGPISPQLRLNCKKVYLTVANYRLFLKFQIKAAIILHQIPYFPKFLHWVWFTRFIVDYTMNSVMYNALNTLLKK